MKATFLLGGGSGSWGNASPPRQRASLCEKIRKQREAKAKLSTDVSYRLRRLETSRLGRAGHLWRLRVWDYTLPCAELLNPRLQRISKAFSIEIVSFKHDVSAAPFWQTCDFFLQKCSHSRSSSCGGLTHNQDQLQEQLPAVAFSSKASSSFLVSSVFPTTTKPIRNRSQSSTVVQSNWGCG